MDKEILVEYGLSKREAEVYYILLGINEALASEISEKAKESRTNTYDTLNSLIKKGLVSYVIKNNKKYFMATNPRKLLDWIDFKKEELEKKKKEMEKLIPYLAKLRLPKEKKVNVEVYEGKEGIRTMLKETIDSSIKSTKREVVLTTFPSTLLTISPVAIPPASAGEPSATRTTFTFSPSLGIPDTE